MGSNEFSREQLEKMITEDLAVGDKILSGEYSETGKGPLSQNVLPISKQLLAILKSGSGIKIGEGKFSAEELETMIHDYESFWETCSRSHSFSDVDNQMAGKLPNQIFWITKQLIEVM